MNTLQQKNPLVREIDAATASYKTRGDVPTPAEETLRLIARLPAPQGLAERVKTGLRADPPAPRMASGRARVLAWPTMRRRENTWMRGAAAAAIALLVAGGGWGIYVSVAPLQPHGAAVLPQGAAPSGFSSAGAVRRPQTLNRPVVKHSAAPAPSAAGTAAKPAARPKATPLHHSKAAPANPAAAPSAAPAAKPSTAASTEE
jgi:hypothetical protein